MHDVRVSYGAVGDGVADDTDAIEAAIRAADAEDGAVVYLPAGRYRTTRPLAVNPRRMSLRGEGPQVTTLLPELPAGEYALTLGWDGNQETSAKSGPFDALSGMAIRLPAGAGQASAIRMHNTTSTNNKRAHSMTLRDVSLYGGEVQLELGDYVYLARMDRVFFTDPNLYAVRLGQTSTSGENISFDACVFAGGAATMVYLDMTGASLFFNACSFDYCRRAIWQRAGQVSFVMCHFEADGRFGGPGTEFLLLDRRGYVNRPMMTLTDCEFFAAWDSYDTCIRLRGDNGDQGLRIVNPYVKTTAAMPYLVRDDGPYPSSITVSGMWTSNAGYVPKLRKSSGDVPLTPGGSL